MSINCLTNLGGIEVRMINIVMLAVIALLVSACGDDKGTSTNTAKNDVAPTAVESPEPMAADGEYGQTIDHARDEAEFELRRSIGGLDRMIEQYTADGYATDDLKAQKAELVANLDALLGSG